MGSMNFKRIGVLTLKECILLQLIVHCFYELIYHFIEFGYF